MATKKADPAPAAAAPAPASREENTAYLAGVITKVLSNEKVGDEDYKRVVGYLDRRRGGLSEAGLARFAGVEEVKGLHDTARAGYADKARTILTDHKDILLKMFNAKPGQKSVTKAEYALIAPILEEPLSRRDEKGGLLKDAYKVANELDAKDIIKAAALYRETIRVHVLSPLYLSGIYVRQANRKTVTADEREDLKKGITVIEGDKPVNKAFVENGKLTKFALETIGTARRMLGGDKGKVLETALQISDGKSRRSQIAPPKTGGPDLEQ